MDDLVAFASPSYWVFFGLLALGRGMDLLSTWVASPQLLLEANPIARALGWRWGIVVNLVVSVFLGMWPMPAIGVATTSLLVAARNFQSAWLMRSMGEADYRAWISDRFAETSRWLFISCILAQGLLFGLVGSALLYFGQFGRAWRVVSGIGCGIVVYALAVVGFSLLPAWRHWRASRAAAKLDCGVG